MRDTAVIHTSEICLKGANRAFFEKALAKNLADRLGPIGTFAVSRRQGSMLATHDGPLGDAQVLALERALAGTFGVGTFTIAARAAKTVEDIARVAAELLAKEGPTTFKVYARRSDKTFPLNSEELASEIGGRLLDGVPGAKVDVHSPKTRVEIEIGPGAEALVAVGRHAGPGGLPAKTAGRVVALLSGGIDSPVAAWKLMSRGCETVFIHFHSYPYVGRSSIEKVERLARILAEWQGATSLFLVPLAGVQQEIVAKADPAMRVILYRRAMFRLAERLADRVRAEGIVTGDSVGQVASQTLRNLSTVSAATHGSIYRPLIGDDKDAIVSAARRIGTYETSIQPHDDCCSVFMPPRPATVSTPRGAEREEAKCALAPLEDAAFAAKEHVTIGAPATLAARAAA